MPRKKNICDLISSCRPFARRIRTLVQHREHDTGLFQDRRCYQWFIIASSIAHSWKLDFCAPGEIFFSSGRLAPRATMVSVFVIGRPIQPLEMHCPFLAQTVAFPPPPPPPRSTLGKSFFRRRDRLYPSRRKSSRSRSVFERRDVTSAT